MHARYGKIRKIYILIIIIDSRRTYYIQILTRTSFSSIVQLTAIALAASHRAHIYSTKFAICIHVCMANPVRSGFKPSREVDLLNAHSIRIGSIRIQCGCNQCVFDVQCGQALGDSRKVELSADGSEAKPSSFSSYFHLLYIPCMDLTSERRDIWEVSRIYIILPLSILHLSRNIWTPEIFVLPE